jgi:hypothetical protein
MVVKMRVFMIRKNVRFWESLGQIGNLLQAVIVALFLLILYLVGCGKPTKSESEKVDFSEKIKHYEELAYKFAPIYVQAFKSKYDIPTNFDFDGDFIGNNNWENAEKFEFSPYVYWDVKESENFLFFYYALFYPRDYLEDCENPPHVESCHKNDWEQMLVVVKKPEMKTILFETLPHVFDIVYLKDYSADLVVSGVLMKGKNPHFVDQRPVIFIEWGGHGQYGSPEDIVEKEFFSFESTKVLVPEKFDFDLKSDSVLKYKLIYIYDVFWPRKDDVGEGKTFDNYFEFEVEGIHFKLPKNFDGDVPEKGKFVKDAASAPWYAHSVPGEEGIWFVHPVEILKKRGIISSDKQEKYLFNPYIDVK